METFIIFDDSQIVPLGSTQWNIIAQYAGVVEAKIPCDCGVQL